MLEKGDAFVGEVIEYTPGEPPYPALHTVRYIRGKKPNLAGQIYQAVFEMGGAHQRIGDQPLILVSRREGRVVFGIPVTWVGNFEVLEI